MEISDADTPVLSKSDSDATIISGPAPGSVPAWSSHYGLTSTAAWNLATNQWQEWYNGPSVAYDPDRKCWVVAGVEWPYTYDADTGQFTIDNYVSFYTITADADGDNIAGVYAGNTNGVLMRNVASNASGNLKWAGYDGGQPHESVHLHYDPNFDQMHFTSMISFSFMSANSQQYDTPEKGLAEMVFRGRTTAAGGGAATAYERALTYGLSNMQEFIGFNTTQATNGNTATIAVAGGLNESVSGLTRGKRYLIGDDGLLKTGIPGIASFVHRAGVATDTSKLLVDGSSMNRHV